MKRRKAGLFSQKEGFSSYKTRALLTFAAVIILLTLIPAASPADSPRHGAPEAKSLKILKKIFDEVKEMGPYAGEDFIRRDFFTGSDDDDDTYKDNHVAILIQAAAPLEKMKIQITIMVPSEGSPQVKIAKTTKNIICVVEGDKTSLQASDYEEKELAKTVAEILQAVVSKKRLLKENGIKQLRLFPG
jgi:hypothetical protein